MRVCYLPQVCSFYVYGCSAEVSLKEIVFFVLFFFLVIKQHPEILKELETCVNFVPPELVDGERTAPETLELASNIKKAHVTGETLTPDNYMDVSIYLMKYTKTFTFTEK